MAVQKYNFINHTTDYNQFLTKLNEAIKLKPKLTECP